MDLSVIAFMELSIAKEEPDCTIAAPSVSSAYDARSACAFGRTTARSESHLFLHAVTTSFTAGWLLRSLPTCLRSSNTESCSVLGVSARVHVWSPLLMWGHRELGDRNLIQFTRYGSTLFYGSALVTNATCMKWKRHFAKNLVSSIDKWNERGVF